MSAKAVLDQMRMSDGQSMANTIPPTKRGRKNSARKHSIQGRGEGDAPYQPGAGQQKRQEPELIAYDHCCGIHGAARERKGIKKGTSAARRRLSKEILKKATLEMEGEQQMEGYLGEKVVEKDETPFSRYTQLDWIGYFIDHYGGIDGSHHKQWLLDLTMRLCHNAPVRIKLAQWADETGKIIHEEWRPEVLDPEDSYEGWISEREANGDDWDRGTPP